jgi:hypothetical protein
VYAINRARRALPFLPFKDPWGDHMFTLHRRFAAVATATVTAALACGSLLGPAVANAATPAAVKAPATPLSIVASVPGTATAPLVHGLGTETVTLTVSNNTGRAVAFHPLVEGYSHGVIAITPSQVSLSVQNSHAPATSVVRTGHDDETFDSLVPAGKPSGTVFSIPAKGSFTWKLSYGIKDSFPANDPDLALNFRALAGGPLDGSLAGAGASVDLGIAPGHSHPFSEFLTGGSTVAPGKPLYLDLNMSNYTGAAVRGTFGTQFSADGLPSDSKRLLNLEVLEGGHWMTLKNLYNEDSWVLPSFTGSIANGANHEVALRLQVADNSINSATGTVDLSGMTSLSQGQKGYLLSGFQFRPVTALK